MDVEIVSAFAEELKQTCTTFKSCVDQLKKTLSFSGQYEKFSKNLYMQYSNATALELKNFAALASEFKKIGPACSEFNDLQARTEALNLMSESLDICESFCEELIKTDGLDENKAQKLCLNFDQSIASLAERARVLNSTTISALIAARDEKAKRKRLA